MTNLTAKQNNSFTPIMVALGVCLLTTIALFPYLKYYIDPDATSYLTIVKRYLSNDFKGAINAFWSPLGIWGTVGMHRLLGGDIFTNAIQFNTIAALGTTGLAQLLFQKFNTHRTQQLIFAIVSGMMWAIFNYQQSFTDLWQYFFILLGIVLILKDNFVQKPLLWIGVGCLGTLAYFGKAYSFYFFPAMLLAVLMYYYFFKKNISKATCFQIAIVAIGTQVLLASPWIYILSKHYGFLTFSTAGKLNMSWWLMGTNILHDHFIALVPPKDASSIFYFEDPWLIQKSHPRFWHHPSLFIKQLARTAYNALLWIKTSNALSPFYFITWIVSILIIATKKLPLLDAKLAIILIVFLLYPLPFWLLTFDGGRYLWVTLPLALILIAKSIQYLAANIQIFQAKSVQNIVFTIVCCSFLASPLLSLKDMWNEGKTDYETAQILKDNHLSNISFFTNQVFMSSYGQSMLRTAYYANNQFYAQLRDEHTFENLLKDAQKYGVKYYFHYHTYAEATGKLLLPDGTQVQDVLQGKVKGLSVYKIY